jgi:predicted AlkP superfamily phosphohydrolase/phosphomutase
MVIGLDGLEPTLAERLMADGEMPALASLRRRSATFLLDHGPAQRTGLAWEHAASGLSPEAGGRWAAVEFDPTTYAAWQEGARFAPWWRNLDRRTVVFDTPYVDLRRAPGTRGVVGWGVHDPGTSTMSSPSSLLGEFERAFGPYPAARFTYGMPFPSEARTREMGETLTRAVDTRTRAARWLAERRLPDWDLFVAVVGELHGSVEGLWHGVDASHPLHAHPASAPAAEALLSVHRAVDRMVAGLVEAAGDAAVVAFNMGGMGANHSDVQSMVLLAELLYRDAFGESLLTLPAEWTASSAAVPVLEEGRSWSEANREWISEPDEPVSAPPTASYPALRAAARRLPAPVKDLLRGVRRGFVRPRPRPRIDALSRQPLTWQPAMRYRRYWPRMPAFALPSYYDGRIRINLEGREREGVVKPSDYERTCARLEKLLRECRDPRTGEPSVEAIERSAAKDPLALTPSDADLLVVWRGVAAALEHPVLGTVGPVPLRRTGGHTGPHGFAYLAAPGIEAGDRGVRSAFDVVPTIATLLGERPPSYVSGTSLLETRAIEREAAG